MTRLSASVFSLVAAAHLAAQAPAPKPAAPPAGQPPAAAQPPAPARPRPHTPPAARTTTATITVTDGTGKGLGDVAIEMTGPIERSGRTAANGTVHFAGLRAGDYRLHFEHDGFITLERDVTVKYGQPIEVDATLTAAPPPPKPAPAPEPTPVPVTAPPGDPRSVLLVDYIEKNAVKEDQLGCTASARTTLLLLRENTTEQARTDADEVLYVVAGEGTLRLGNKDVPLKSSSLAIVPRGTVRAITRKGKNPIYLLSIVSGPPCTK